MPEFISALAHFCRARHGRVSELAAHLGIAQPHVSAWLTGRQQPSGEHTLQIQAWLAAQRDEAEPVRPSRRPPAAPSAPEESPPVWLL
jgi:DNA-binding transcriptional regulator YdaS (Cro superfamily)